MRGYCFCVLLFFVPLSCSHIPKEYLDTLLAHSFFRGFDLVASIDSDSEDNLMSWYKEQNNSIFSLAIAETNLSQSLEDIREKTSRSAQIAVIIEFRNVSHIESQFKFVRQYATNASIAQPVYFIIAPTPEIYEELQENEDGLTNLALEFSINGDVYIFGEERNQSGSGQTKKKQKHLLNDLKSNGLTGSPFPEGFGLMELYSLKGMVFLEEVNLRETSLLQKVIRRTDFRNANITAVAQFGYPERTNFTEDNSTFTTGYEVDELKFLAASFNFTINPIMGTGWVSLDEDQNLKGMAAQILNREADISISSSEMLPYRSAQLSFLHPTYYITIWGFFKQPASSSLRDIFINAFSLDLWLTMFATWFLIIMTMGALAIVKWRLGTLHENDKTVIQEVFIWAAGAMCQQGWHVCPESGCMKIVFIFALITGLVSYVGYSAALVSILSVKVVPIQSLSDLVSNRYTIYHDSHTLSTDYIIQNLESSGYVKRMPYEQRSVESEDALKKMLKSQTAFLGVTDLFYSAARSLLCTDLKVCRNIHKISISKNRPVQGGMFVRKRSSYLDFFNHRILLMYERGIRHRLLENYFRASTVSCLDLNASDKEPLGLNDVVTAYVILLLGYLLSFLIFVVEKLWKTNVTFVDSSTSTPVPNVMMYYST